MNKKIIIFIIIITILLIVGVTVYFSLNKRVPEPDNTLYIKDFGEVKLKFVKYDYALGQNQIVGVEKSIDGGKTYERITNEPIIVSMEPEFIFLDENLGFAISKKKLSKTNNYIGLKVTNDGGITFVDGIINYDNPDIEVLSIKNIPYKDNNTLKLLCSIYQVKEDKTGYEYVDLIFESTDNGLSWNYVESSNSVTLTLKEETLTSIGATFILKNDTNDVYWYGSEYIIRKKENDNWVNVKTINGKPLIFTSIAYVLNPYEEKEIEINWSYGYGKLTEGEYAIVKTISKEREEQNRETTKMDLYGEFIIK